MTMLMIIAPSFCPVILLRSKHCHYLNLAV